MQLFPASSLLPFPEKFFLKIQKEDMNFMVVIPAVITILSGIHKLLLFSGFLKKQGKTFPGESKSVIFDVLVGACPAHTIHFL